MIGPCVWLDCELDIEKPNSGFDAPALSVKGVAEVSTFTVQQNEAEPAAPGRPVSANEPAGVTPTLGPDATGVGWVYQYAVIAAKRSLAELRTTQDWQVRFAVAKAEGVAEVGVQELPGVPHRAGEDQAVLVDLADQVFRVDVVRARVADRAELGVEKRLQNGRRI